MATSNLVSISQPVYSVSKQGIITWHAEVIHAGLGRRTTIKAGSQDAVVALARSKATEWEHQWSARVAANALAESRRQAQLSKIEAEAEAAQQTQRAKDMLAKIAGALAHTLEVDDAIDWESLKDRSAFPEPKPTLKQVPSLPPAKVPSPQPRPIDFQPQLSLVERLIRSRRDAATQAGQEAFEKANANWKRSVETLDRERKEEIARREEMIAKNAERHHIEAAEWEKKKAAFVERQLQQHAEIDAQHRAYELGEQGAVLAYVEQVLTRSDYPDFMPGEWEIEYNTETKTVTLDYALPPPDTLPTLTEVKYAPRSGEFTEKHLTPAKANEQYDNFVYQVCLRTLHEIFEADRAQVIDAIGLNGLVTAIDRSTGVETTNCILSLHVRREEFLKINLANVDPKACFRQLRGVGSSKLHSVTAVAPVISLRRDDGRFVSERNVTSQLDGGYNLAAMHWEDFEHLIREVFALEFSGNGSEVKVTRASRDGGVDAVVFDPDPIRGGKIVIQAKRYTNTVGVAAVRDLYGTVMNEGASKGILVTTSDYGPDAYEFVQGKPLTLLSGSNLLHLLEKHGHRARIDLAEARKLALAEGAGS